MLSWKAAAPQETGTMRRPTILFATLLLCVSPYACLPHPSCKYTATAPTLLECTTGTKNLPGDFAVDLVPDVATLRIGCPSYSASYFCNTLHDDCEPLPFRPALLTVTLQGFQSANNGSRPRFEKLLQNVAPHITALHITNSRIVYLDAELLRGFASLKVLQLSTDYVQDIAPTAFQALRFPLRPGFNVTVSSQLTELLLFSNELREFDLAVLKPVSSSLNSLDLSSQNPGLTALIRSGRSFPLRLSSFAVNSNGLTNVSYDVLRPIGPRNPSSYTFNFYTNRFCMGVTSPTCSCCEVEDFFHWMRGLRKPNTNTGVYFSCNGASWDARTQFTSDVFRSCPSKIDTATISACYEAPPITITCSIAGEMTTNEPNVDKSDASSLIFTAINGSHCRSALYDIQGQLVKLADGNTHDDSSESSPEVITAHCSEGKVEVFQPITASVTQLKLSIDASGECRAKLRQFVTFIYTKKFPQPPKENTGDASETVGLIPISRWINEFLICSEVPPLVVSCNGTATTFSYDNTTIIDATELIFESDNSLRCRKIASNVHRHILSQRNTVVESGVSEDWEPDAVVAACQKDQVVLSDGNPEQAVFANLRYYSAPNQLCRDAFNRFAKYLWSSLA
ncbi:uncharacterized protein LOC129588876 [Paramacrobiotus metropolitanus]|uniref:uncharacterized protein LOC129588876 n=1 Tax=Paramacrobiotus metropolitanus TaxID=2943436 RepID=UPI0024465991|nr:uncharacterized protein LOC129588876 [Paramacrobiotus metropolitanus]